MKIVFKLITIHLLCTLLISNSFGQFTLYDDLPGIDKLEKPAISEDYPAWGKMLYHYPINMNELESNFKMDDSNYKKKSPLLRYYKKYIRALKPFTLKNGDINIPSESELREYYRKGTKQSHIAMGSRNGSWTFVGPKVTHWLNEGSFSSPPPSCPWQVNIYTFDVSKLDHDVLFAGTETGFVNKSIDGGETWSLVSRDYDFGGAIGALAINPIDDNIVIVSAGKQIHRSNDGGQTWIKLLSNNFFGASKMVINPTNPKIILAASGDGLFVSHDGGDSWINKKAGPTFDVDFKPNDSNTSYALIKVSNGYALYSSEDNAESYSNNTNFPDSYLESSGGVIATTSNNPSAVFATLLTANNTPVVLKGINTGNGWLWDEIAQGNSSLLAMNNGQGYYDLDMEVSPLDEDKFFVATTTMYKTTNGGNSFTTVGGYGGEFSIHPDIQDILILDDETTWVATDGGMNYSSDFFSSQENYRVAIDGIVGSDFWGFDQGWNEDIMVGGRYHNGNTAITDFYGDKALRMGGAESPTGWILQGKSRHVAFDDLGNGWILPTTPEAQPEGRFLFTKFPNMVEYGGRRGNMVHHPMYSGELYLGEGTAFWKSIDFGQNWELLFNFGNQVRYLQISYSNPLILYADIVGSGLHKSEDGGVTWQRKSPPNGNNQWSGRLHFAVSPSNENKIYACLQNGTWSEDKGEIYLSEDGGDTWTNISFGMKEYLKNIVVQPSDDGDDLVYLFTNAILGNDANVYTWQTGVNEWQEYNLDYPKGMDVNIAIPFYRDGKMRVAGNGGVWEAPLLHQNFAPILTPWTDSKLVNCYLDTIRLDDHSILKHEGVTWSWDITPQPLWSDDLNSRNPKIVLGKEGAYDVEMTVTANGQEYKRKEIAMITALECPSIDNCNNPVILPKNDWNLISVDSEETTYPGLATMAFDGKGETIWHTRWSSGTDPYPHEIVVDLTEDFKTFEFVYQGRTDGVNGRIKEYELYMSNDLSDWGAPVSEGAFINTSAPQKVKFVDGEIGRYFKLVALSEVNGGPWASAAELSFLGCVAPVSAVDKSIDLSSKAYPMPVEQQLIIDVPFEGMYEITCFSTSGQKINSESISSANGQLRYDMSTVKSGIYILKLKANNSSIFKVKVLKI